MGTTVLRSAMFGGYDKADVLTVIDSLNAAKLAFEEGSISADALRAAVEEARTHQFVKKSGGFAKKDVESYVGDLCDEMLKLAE